MHRKIGKGIITIIVDNVHNRMLITRHVHGNQTMPACNIIYPVKQACIIIITKKL